LAWPPPVLSNSSSNNRGFATSPSAIETTGSEGRPVAQPRAAPLNNRLSD
jgi:hypothetical protein